MNAIPRRGRPTPEQAQALSRSILDAAAELMLRHGYAGASLAAIAQRAGVTKRTIYARFGAKENLLRAVLAAIRDKLTLHYRPPAQGDARVLLEHLGNHLLGQLSRPAMVAWCRFTSVEMGRSPEFAELVHPLMDGVYAFVETMLRELARDHRLPIADAALAARLFVMLVGEPMKQHAFFYMSLGTAAQRREHVRRMVGVFLAAARAGEI
ncbi:TetR/AcrR family transcriptional regulator [Orrella sp. JC864]|uniref:TetR/AcrR family transcriptional regulator n=1 Tax=Orrella sp. JC864 TaxID=3120298 RepID=UPI00300B2C65